MPPTNAVKETAEKEAKEAKILATIRQVNEQLARLSKGEIVPRTVITRRKVSSGYSVTFEDVPVAKRKAQRAMPEALSSGKKGHLAAVIEPSSAKSIPQY
jgi:hypothetical protein